MVKELFCADPSDFEATIETAKASSKHVFAYFAAGSCGLSDSWCGDCVRAQKYGLPVLYSRIEGDPRLADAVVVHLLVPTAAEWCGNSTHPYRAYTPTGIPTLTWMNAPKSVHVESVGEKECSDPDAVNRFVDSVLEVTEL